MKSLLKAIQDRDTTSITDRFYCQHQHPVPIYSWDMPTHEQQQQDIAQRRRLTIDDMLFLQEVLMAHVSDGHKTMYGKARMIIYAYVLNMEYHIHGATTTEQLTQWAGSMTDIQFWMGFADSYAKENYGQVFHTLPPAEKKTLLHWYVTLHQVSYNHRTYASMLIAYDNHIQSVYEHKVFHIIASHMDADVLNLYDPDTIDDCYDSSNEDDMESWDEADANHEPLVSSTSVAECYYYWLFAQRDGYVYEGSHTLSGIDELWMDILVQTPWNAMTLSQWTAVLYPEPTVISECALERLL